MAPKFGTGSLQYEFVEGWERKPARMRHDDVSGICTDSCGNVYLLCRGAHPVMVYDRDGYFIDCWGEGKISYMTGGMFMTENDEILLVDDGGSSVALYTIDGEKKQAIGPEGVPSDSGFDGKNIDSVTCAAPPYNRPSKAVAAPWGEIYVADGEGNCRVHRFSASGELLGSWGSPGTGPGEFKCVHSVWAHTDERIFVVDRQNDRIQIFTREGAFVSEWTDVQRPHDIFIDKNNIVYVCDSFYPKGAVSSRRGRISKDEPARMSIFDIEGNLLLRWSDPDAQKPGYFHSPHGLWVDDEGSIYIANNATAGAKARGEKPCSFGTQKFVRI